MGAQGVWTGSLWLTVEEADIPPAQKQQLLDATSSDTVRSRSFTGKPCRMLKSDWTEAWEAREPRAPPHAPAVHGLRRVRRPGHPLRRQGPRSVFNPFGQIVGQLGTERKTRDVMQDLVEDYIEAVERLSSLNG